MSPTTTTFFALLLTLLPTLILAQPPIPLPTPLPNPTFQQFNVPKFKYPPSTHPSFASRLIFNNLTSPRTILFDSQNNLLVIEQGVGVSALHQILIPPATEGGQTRGGWLKETILLNPNVTHGLALDENAGILYVDTPTSILAYPGYNATTRKVAPSDGFTPYPLLINIPTEGVSPNHNILFERSKYPITSSDSDSPPIPYLLSLVISTSAQANIDYRARNTSSSIGQVRRFVYPEAIAAIYPPFPFDYNRDAELVASGLRDIGGIAFAQREDVGVPVDGPGAATGAGGRAKRVYISDSSAYLSPPPDSGGFAPPFESENPADELNSFILPAAVRPPPTGPATTPNATKSPYFGFPDCATVYRHIGTPPGAGNSSGLVDGGQFSLALPEEGGVTEVRDQSWCQNAENNKEPALVLEPHSSPQSIVFRSTFSALAGIGNKHALPIWTQGDAFVALRGGSRDIDGEEVGTFDDTSVGGFGVVHMPYPQQDTSNYTYIVQAQNLTACIDPAVDAGCIRPVGLAFGGDGKLYVSSDETGELFVLDWDPLEE